MFGALVAGCNHGSDRFVINLSANHYTQRSSISPLLRSGIQGNSILQYEAACSSLIEQLGSFHSVKLSGTPALVISLLIVP